MNESSGWRTRSFTAGRAAFEVNCPTEHVRDAVEEMLVDLPEASDRSIDRVIEITERVEGMLCVTSGDDVGGIDQRPNNALSTLATAVTRLALDHDPDRLHLHCAALELDGRGVVISAASGTGKTTLAATLATSGWTYLTDESVAVENDATRVSGFPKPLMIKTGARELLPQLGTHRIAIDPDDDLYWHVPASALSVPTTAAVAPAAIVILHRPVDGRTEVASDPVPLGRADAVVALMGETLDAERFGPDAVHVLARLTARSRCVTLAVGPVEPMESALRGLIEQPDVPGVLHVFDVPLETAVSGWRIPPRVRSASIDGCVVAHDPSTGAIVALDEVGSGVWSRLHGESPSWWDAEILETEATRSFLRRLASVGLVVDVAEVIEGAS